MNKQQKLIKENQILNSWNWFYNNSSENLMCSRYAVKAVTYKDKNGVEKNKYVYPNVEDVWNKHYYNTLDYSLRFKQDKVNAQQCWDKIVVNFNELEKFYKKK